MQNATLHLIGGGKVGQALMRLLPYTPYRLIAVTDRTGTVHGKAGLDAVELADLKQGGGAIRALAEAEAMPVGVAVNLVGADIVVDATSTDVSAGNQALERSRAILRGGQKLVLCAKDALCLSRGELFSGEHLSRLGFNAVLGGTGALLKQELTELRAHCSQVALVGNASTTAVIETLEAGGTMAEGVRRIQERGILEPDPELDLSGTDAATKLGIVAGALWFGQSWVGEFDICQIPRQHIQDLDVKELRARRDRGATTRLVARGDRDGHLQVTYEEIDLDSPLVAPADRVVYAYSLAAGQMRVHVGTGVGPVGTATAILADVAELCR
ncbi:MAG: hypothetical protein ACYTF5_14810 [Planctomycetota bacterium]